MNRTASIALTLAAVFMASHAYATGLSVRTIEYGTWPGAVAALQGDLNGEGRTVRVFVRDSNGQPVACESYTLTLDEIGATAFAIGRCDPATNATAVRLIHRAALFNHNDIVPEPLRAGISAVEVQTGGASGGAGNVGGSEVSCSVSVRPYLTNMETGARVFLQAPRFTMRLQSAGVIAEHGATAGWTLRTWDRGTVSVEYDVVDTRRNIVVVHDQATLRCTSGRDQAESADERHIDQLLARVAPTRQPQPAPAPDARHLEEVATSCAEAPLLSSGALADGSTLGGARQPLYRLDVSGAGLVNMMLTSSFGGEVDIYRGCPTGRQSILLSGVFGGGDAQHLSWSLAPGTYYVAIVDADIHQHVGEFSFTVGMAFDPFASTDLPGERNANTGLDSNCQLIGDGREGVRCDSQTRGNLYR